MRIGNIVRMSMNSSPQWEARSNGGHRIQLFEQDGMAAFHSPIDGDGRVTLTFPTSSRFYLLTVLSLIVLVAVAIRSSAPPIVSPR